MPYDKIEFSNQQASGHEELAGGSPIAMNVVRDSLGTVRRRPGIRAATGIFSGTVDAGGLEGIYSSLDRRLWAIGSASGSARPIYLIGSNSATVVGEGEIGTGLEGSARPTFAETEMLLVMAGGARLQKVELLSSPLASAFLGGSPPQASHVIAHNLRLLSNDVALDKTKVRFSGVSIGTTDFSGNELWATGGPSTNGGFFTAESRPDPVVALTENTNEVFVFGSTTLQLFASDPVFTYAPVSTSEYGCAAGSSVIKADGFFAWLDPQRRFVMSSGRDLDVISEPIEGTLDTIERVDDCFGYRVVSGPIDILVWTFPSDGRTFAFQKGKGWSQWSGWNDSTANWSPLSVSCHSLRLSDGSARNIVGTVDGRIGEMSLSATTDFGEPINAYVVSGYLNRGTETRKQCRCVRFVLRRGRTTGSIGPQAFFSFRDQPGPFEPRIPIDLGSSSDHEIVVEFHSLGVYRRRQWQFTFTGDDELVLVGAFEDYEVLED